MSACPGTNKRNMEEDMRLLTGTHGINHIVCLLNEAELRVRGSLLFKQGGNERLQTVRRNLVIQTLGIRDYKAKVSENGLKYSVMPIVDMAIPENVHDTCALIATISSDMVTGKRVLVHCRQGVGRAGMIAACVLLHVGCAATGDGAIQRLRKKRHKLAVQTSRQEQFVHWYAANMHVTPLSSLPQWLPFASCTRAVSKLAKRAKHGRQQSHDTQPM